MARDLAVDLVRAAGDVWNSPWDVRSTPIDIHLLEVRVREAAREMEQHRDQVQTLTRRIEVGTAKIDAARRAGASEEAIEDAERRLRALCVERDQLRDRYLLPHELLTALLTTARGAIGRPPGSWIGVHVPGVVRCAVSLVANEPPF